MAIPLGKLSEDQVPAPPACAVRDNGTPPYQHDGYVLDADLPEGPARWRYQGPRLIGFMVYNPVGHEKVWRSAWFWLNGY